MTLNDTYMLAIETSSRMGQVAIGKSGEVLAAGSFTAGARHGAELVPAIDKLVRELNLRPNQFGVIAVSAGPGSFTGLRVGFTFARTLSQVTGAKLIAIPSLEVIVENIRPLLADEPGPVFVAPILDAKRKQVYTAGFRWQGGRVEKIVPETVLAPADLLQSLGRPLWITGEGVNYHRESFVNLSAVQIVGEEYWLGRAANVLKLAWPLAQAGKFTDREELVPIYVRLPEAEERWQMRQEQNRQA